VTKEDAVGAAMTKAQSEMGGLNVAVNCAGIGWPRRMVNKKVRCPARSSARSSR
jgi:NAD(P)-dependent dehydrogenase (short-subunit alcohol dehydrogenase family)